MSGLGLVVLDCAATISLQDGGRRGYLRFGLSGSGPMDALAMAAANVLVGNSPEAATVELAHGGAHLRAEGGSLRLALAGAPCPMHLDGEALAAHRSFVLREGAELRIERPYESVFAYLAVAGGFAVAAVLGSVSLHRRAGLGGIDGRGLRAGDRLPAGTATGAAQTDRILDAPPLERAEPVRVVLGPQADCFTEAGLATLTSATFTVSHRADRMGYQLDGPKIAHGAAGFNIVSDATVAGSIQVPGSGSPIVLLADRQTTGGYPKIATVVSADLRRIAQRRPGDPVRFQIIELAEAVRLARARAATIAALPTALRAAPEPIDRLLAANLAGDAVDALRSEF